MSRFSKLPVSLATGIVMLGITVAGGILTLIIESQMPCCGLQGLVSFLFVFLIGPILGITGLVLTVIGLISWFAARKQKGGV